MRRSATTRGVQTPFFGFDEAIQHLERRPAESLHSYYAGRPVHITRLDAKTLAIEPVGCDVSEEIGMREFRAQFAGSDFRALELHEYQL